MTWSLQNHQHHDERPHERRRNTIFVASSVIDNFGFDVEST